jgi:hypothetical protein
MKSRRVHRRKIHRKTKKGGFETLKKLGRSFKNYLNNPNDFKANSLSEYEKAQIAERENRAAERESINDLPLQLSPHETSVANAMKAGKRTRRRHKKRSHRRH